MRVVLGIRPCAATHWVGISLRATAPRRPRKTPAARARSRSVQYGPAGRLHSNCPPHLRARRTLKRRETAIAAGEPNARGEAQASPAGPAARRRLPRQRCCHQVRRRGRAGGWSLPRVPSTAGAGGRGPRRSRWPPGAAARAGGGRSGRRARWRSPSRCGGARSRAAGRHNAGGAPSKLRRGRAAAPARGRRRAGASRDSRASAGPRERRPPGARPVAAGPLRGPRSRGPGGRRSPRLSRRLPYAGVWAPAPPGLAPTCTPDRADRCHRSPPARRRTARARRCARGRTSAALMCSAAR
jgi:hypothetical protein